jgi:hypothetical protein
MTIPNDTTPEAEAVQLEILRRKSPTELANLALRLSAHMTALSKRAIREAHPEFSEREVTEMFVEIHYGKELANAVREYQRKRSSE